MSIVGDNLRTVREARSMTQSDLAARIGKNQRTISQWENGLRDPGTENIRKIADVLDVAPVELIGHNNAPSDTTYQIPVRDNQMYPDIRTGDTLTVSRTDEVRDGDVVIVKMEKKVFCRRLYRHGETGVTLLSYNPNIKPITALSKDIQLEGRVTKVERRL